MADNDKIAETALKRFKYASEVWNPQRIREQEDLAFQEPENQWTDQAKRERQGLVGQDGVPQPARPMLSVSLLSQPKQLIRNGRRQAKLGINIHPKSQDATPETAQVIQGHYREIEQHGADLARGWAFDRAVDCGLGYYIVRTDYEAKDLNPERPGPEVYDQVIRIERILHQEDVYLDPAAKEPDFRDGEFAFLLHWMPIERYKSLYPKAAIPEPGADPYGFEAMISRTPDWVKYDSEIKAVCVAEYWYKTHKKVTFVNLDGDTVIEEEFDGEIPEDAPRRPYDLTTLMYCKLAPGGKESGLQHLEGPMEWNGQYIPIIPVIGEEVQPYGKKRQWWGLVHPNKGAQRFFNFSISSLAERMALEPHAPHMLDPQQIDGYQAWWIQANRRNLPYLPYKRYIDGKDYGAPERSQVDLSGSSLAMLGVQQGRELVQTGTFAYEPSLGKEQSNRSGKAILAEQQQFEISSSGYLYFLADISMNYEATVVLDMMRRVLDRPGRVVQTMDEEGKVEQVMINAPFYRDQSGAPVEMQDGMMAPPGANVQRHSLTEGTYSVVVTVGKSYQSLRQEGGQVLGEILQSHPEMLPIVGPLWAKAQDFPYSQDFMKLLLKLREMQYPGLSADEQQSPEQLAAQNYALQQQLQQAQQQMQQMQMAIETKQVEQQGRMAESQIDNETTIRKAQMDNETRVIIAAMQAELDQVKEALKGKLEQDKIRFQTQGDMEKATVGAGIKAPEFKGPNKQPLPRGDRF